MILNQRVVNPIDGVKAEAFKWSAPDIVDEDRQRAEKYLTKIWLKSRSLWPVRDVEVESMSRVFAAKRIMALSGVQNRQVILSSTHSWVPVLEETAQGTLRATSFNRLDHKELQLAANKLAGTPDADRIVVRFTDYSALHDDGAAFPCLTSQTIGTIETASNGKFLLTEAAYDLNNAPFLVETIGLTLLPLSAEFRLGLSCATLGSKL